MKLTRLSFVLGLSLCSLFASGQDLIPVKNNKDKWGYQDENGKKVIDYKYDEAGFFTNGRAMVRKGDNRGMIGTNGKEIVPIKYNIIESYTDKIYRVAAGGSYKDGVLENEKYGFIDSEGVVILKPEYEEIGQFKDNVAYIKKGDKYGYINDQIQIIIPCKYSAVGTFNQRGHVWVNEGAKMLKGSSKEFSGGNFGLYDKSGKLIIPAKYKKLGCFLKYTFTPTKKNLDGKSFNHQTILKESGSHLFYSKFAVDHTLFSIISDEAVGYYTSNESDARKNAVMDLDGNVLIKEGKYNNAFYPSDGMALVSDKSKYYNYLNLKTGKLLYKKYIYDAWAFQDGVAIITTNDKRQEMIDLTGKTISKSYDVIFPRTNGVHIVMDSGSGKTYYGLLDVKGQEILPATQMFIYPPENGIMACGDASTSMKGYIGMDGKWVIKPAYNAAFSFKNGLAEVKTQNGWGLINTKGEEVVKCQWTNILLRDKQDHKILWVSDETGEQPGYKPLLISSDKLITNQSFKFPEYFNTLFENVAFVGDSEDAIGVLNTDGKLVIPASFTKEQAIAAYEQLLKSGKNEWTDFDTYRVKLYSNPDRNKAKLSSTIESTLWDY